MLPAAQFASGLILAGAGLRWPSSLPRRRFICVYVLPDEILFLRDVSDLVGIDDDSIHQAGVAVRDVPAAHPVLLGPDAVRL